MYHVSISKDTLLYIKTTISFLSKELYSLQLIDRASKSHLVYVGLLHLWVSLQMSQRPQQNKYLKFCF